MNTHTFPSTSVIASSLRLGIILSIVCLLSSGNAQETGKGTAPKSNTSLTDGKVSPKRPAYRFSTRKKKKPKMPVRIGKAPGSSSDEKDKLSEGAVAVGIVTEQATLPAELKEIAQKGTIAVAAKEWDKARTLYLELLKKAPNNALAFANLGVVEHQLRNLSAASANLGRSLQINPSIAQNWLTLGLIQYEKGDLNLAISSLTRAIHEAPNNGQARLILAAVIRDYGWEDAAITELKRALMVDPKLADAHYNLALSYLGFDPPKLELARRHYYSAIDLGTEVSSEIEKLLGPVSGEK